MSDWRVHQFRLSRTVGKLLVRMAALATLGKMPPFVSASAVVLRGTDVLVVLDPIRGEPVIPGGHLRWTEDPRDAVGREAREETGMTVEPIDLLGVFSGERWAGEKGIVRVVFLARVTGGALRPSPEGQPCWMPADEFASLDVRDAPLVRLALDRAAAETSG